MGLVFPIRDVPFSYAGSWFNISPVIGERRYSEDLHLVSHQTQLHPVLRFTPVRDGQRVDATVTATPAETTWRHGEHHIGIAFEGPDTVRVRGAGLGLRLFAADATLTPFAGAYFGCLELSPSMSFPPELFGIGVPRTYVNPAQLSSGSCRCCGPIRVCVLP